MSVSISFERPQHDLSVPIVGFVDAVNNTNGRLPQEISFGADIELTKVPFFKWNSNGFSQKKREEKQEEANQGEETSEAKQKGIDKAKELGKGAMDKLPKGCCGECGCWEKFKGMFSCFPCCKDALDKVKNSKIAQVTGDAAVKVKDATVDGASELKSLNEKHDFVGKGKDLAGDYMEGKEAEEDKKIGVVSRINKTKWIYPFQEQENMTRQILKCSGNGNGNANNGLFRIPFQIDVSNKYFPASFYFEHEDTKVKMGYSVKYEDVNRKVHSMPVIIRSNIPPVFHSLGSVSFNMGEKDKTLHHDLKTAQISYGTDSQVDVSLTISGGKVEFIKFRILGVLHIRRQASDDGHSGQN